MMRAVIFNCSTKYYNRGTEALGYWLQEQGCQVEQSTREPDLFSLDARLFCFSAIFTWDLPRLTEWVNRVKDFGEVWIGGPAVSAMPRYVENETGIKPTVGIDSRFEQQPGHYKMTRTSRGCPVGCSFCIVPKIDGRAMVEYPDFSPAPVVMDDNILACSVQHQEHVIERLLEQDYRAVDLNSGFEPSYFTAESFARFSRLPLKFWRLAFDETKEEKAVYEMIRLLREGGIKDSRAIRVYCLSGNEPFENCHYRAEKIIEWGGEPFVQALIPLNALSKTPVVQSRFGWTEQLLTDFSRYYNRWLWRKSGRSFDWYDRSARTSKERTK
jgi:hypothetical protein